MGKSTTIDVPKGYQLTLTTDSSSNGHYASIGAPGQSGSTLKDISASSTVLVGPFNEERVYRITSLNGVITHAIEYSGIYTRTDEVDLHKYIAMRW